MLEEKIDELIAVVKELTATIKAQSGAAPKKTKTKKEEVNKDKPKEGEKPAAGEKKSDVTLDDLKEAIKNLCAKDGGRDLAISILGEFNAEKATEVDETQYAACIEVLKKGLEDE